MRTAAIFVALVSLARATCVTVPSDRILARDVSTAIPRFQALDPEAMIGFSPFPGTKRVLTSRDLLLSARRYGLTFSPSEPVPSLCVERTIHSLSVEDLKEAMLSALDAHGARLEIV